MQLLDFGFLCFRGPLEVLYLLFVPSALRGIQHVTICTFQFCKKLEGVEKLGWFGVRGSGLPSPLGPLVRNERLH